MADTPPTRLPLEPPDNESANGTRPFEELRHLILAPEQEALERLHDRVASVESRTEDVSTVVAEAIQRRRDQGGDEDLSEALAPTIETALRESVRKDPTTLADALFPVMGPAIRRSILETLRSFLDSFNQIMDQSLSWQGLKWRLEGLRTGRSFTEVVLLHSLIFRVEQVFLIHKKTGLSLGHAAAPSVAMQDPSLVSGMLSAIQDFVRDSFDAAMGQGIERMNVGDLDVWVEEGPYAILATVIRGVAPRELRDRMAEVLENIHREYSAQLDRFNGDAAPFVHINKELSRCLELQYKNEEKKTGRGYVWAAGGLLVLLLGGWLCWREWQFHRWADVVEKLREQPGLVLSSLARERGRFVIRGMRDPLAVEPGQFVKAQGLDPGKAEFHWAPYYALDDTIVEQRAVQLLSPPAGVTLHVNDGVLQLEGRAPLPWLEDLRNRAVLVPGIRRVELSGPNSPEQIALNEAKNEIQSSIVKFPIASASLSSRERDVVKVVAAKLKDILAASGTAESALVINVNGHSDSTGAEATNRTLSQRRADRVAAELGQLGVASKNMKATGVATTDPLRPEDTEENRQYNRSVTFRISSLSP
ncbi:MAG TPA: OmpA family protein [Candidatus Acidoferrum sp.]|nr:OmpA family protein [Candidatus Acidoferrum sp.]